MNKTIPPFPTVKPLELQPMPDVAPMPEVRPMQEVKPMRVRRQRQSKAAATKRIFENLNKR